MSSAILNATNERIAIGRSNTPHEHIERVRSEAQDIPHLIAVINESPAVEQHRNNELQIFNNGEAWVDCNRTLITFLIAHARFDFFDDAYGAGLSALVTLEPELKPLWCDAGATTPKDMDYSTVTYFIDAFKPRVTFLVGYSAGIHYELLPKPDGCPLYSVGELEEYTKKTIIKHPPQTFKTSAAYDLVYNWILDLLPEKQG